MLIIKPYGRSHVDTSPNGRRRTLHLNTTPTNSKDIAEFAKSDPRLVIAQWISAIDKIATKPKANTRPTAAQRAFRKKLGEACWQYIETHQLVPGLDDKEINPKLHTLWWSKIEPYDKKDFSPKRKPPAVGGRWYKRFAGEAKPEHVDGASIAEKLHEHLYVSEYRIDATRPNKRKGRINARAESIEKNVLKPPQKSVEGWNAKDEADYLRAGDIAQAIYAAAETAHNTKDHNGRARPRRLTLSEASVELFKQYGHLFRDKSGTPLSIEEAKAQHTHLFDLHMAVKDFYKRRLKHSKRQNILTSLPKDSAALFTLLKVTKQNQDLAGLVRLGKVIHYEMSHQAWESGKPAETEEAEWNRLKGLMTSWSRADRFAQYWPKNIEESAFWTSKGQEEIQRHEAFVRIWRHIMTLANRTLTDWAYPDTHISHDIFEGKKINHALKQVSAEQHKRKLDLLFGKHGDLLASNNLAPKILETAIKRMAYLRNNSFHFTDKRIFATALTRLTENVPNEVKPSLSALWQADNADRTAAIGRAMQAVHATAYFDETQNRNIFTAVKGAPPSLLALPRFRRIIVRAENAWGHEKDRPGLPEPANRQALEDPARLCQYATTKQLYDGPFRHWLDTRSAQTVNLYIGRAVDRATKAAQNMNGKQKTDEEKALIASRATHLPRLDETKGGETIRDFFFRLAASTATEMRVQKGYESDGGNAQKQAEFIEDLKCDVVALALADYLAKHHFTFILSLKPETPLPTEEINLESFATSDAKQRNTSERASDWQAVLYFLLHLIPVDDASRLLHQIRKWMVLEAKSKAEGTRPIQTPDTTILKTVETLELYLAMHDTKFEGGMELTGTDGFKDFYESETGFKKLFSNPENVEDHTVPRRGLREVMRFGHLPLLRQVCGQQTISDSQITEWETANNASPGGHSPIAAQQHKREALHEEYVKSTNTFSIAKIKDYATALSFVSRHRTLAAHVTLSNHVRAHRIMMAVLARLADYAGLWERDLYFVTLAVCYQRGLRPDVVFKNDGLSELAKRQPIKAQSKKLGTSDSNAVQQEIVRYFGNVHVEGNDDVKTRNDLAHFNMLQGGTLNLTEWVNQTRQLMRHDRKLKNAVTQSVRELLAREGLDLTWQIDANAHPHLLHRATLATRYAIHLQKVKGLQPKLLEPLHGEDFIAMICALFNGKAVGGIDPVKHMDMACLDLQRLCLQKNQGRTGTKKPHGKGRSRMQRRSKK